MVGASLLDDDKVSTVDRFLGGPSLRRFPADYLFAAFTLILLRLFSGPRCLLSMAQWLVQSTPRLPSRLYGVDLLGRGRMPSGGPLLTSSLVLTRLFSSLYQRVGDFTPQVYDYVLVYIYIY